MFTLHSIFSMIAGGLAAAAGVFPGAAGYLLGGSAVASAVSVGVAANHSKQAIATAAVTAAATQFAAINPAHPATPIVNAILKAADAETAQSPGA